MKDTDYVNINDANPLYFIINKADGYTEESNQKKYLTWVYSDKYNVTLKKYSEICNKVQNWIEKTTDEPGDYDEKYMNIKINSDDDLP